MLTWAEPCHGCDPCPPLPPAGSAVPIPAVAPWVLSHLAKTRVPAVALPMGRGLQLWASKFWRGWLAGGWPGPRVPPALRGLEPLLPLSRAACRERLSAGEVCAAGGGPNAPANVVPAETRWPSHVCLKAWQGRKRVLYRSHRARLFPKSRLSPRYQVSMNELSMTLEG